MQIIILLSSLFIIIDFLLLTASYFLHFCLLLLKNGRSNATTQWHNVYISRQLNENAITLCWCLGTNAVCLKLAEPCILCSALFNAFNMYKSFYNDNKTFNLDPFCPFMLASNWHVFQPIKEVINSLLALEAKGRRADKWRPAPRLRSTLRELNLWLATNKPVSDGTILRSLETYFLQEKE